MDVRLTIASACAPSRISQLFLGAAELGWRVIERGKNSRFEGGWRYIAPDGFVCRNIKEAREYQSQLDNKLTSIGTSSGQTAMQDDNGEFSPSHGLPSAFSAPHDPPSAFSAPHDPPSAFSAPHDPPSAFSPSAFFPLPSKRMKAASHTPPPASLPTSS